MSIINPTGYYYMSSHEGPGGTPTIEWREGAPKIFYTRNWDDGNEYFYIEFKDGEAFATNRLREILDFELLRAIKDLNNDTYLVLNNSHEAFLSVVEPIYRYIVMGHGIPPEKIILLSGSFDIAEEIERVRPMYNRGPIKAELDMPFEDMAHTFMEVSQHEGWWQAPKTLVDKSYDKKYINFNRRWRVHRPTFVMLLHAYGLLDKGYVSLAPSDDGQNWDQSWKSVVVMNQDFPHLVSLAYKHREELINMPPLYLDHMDLVTNRAMPELGTNYLYENSYFSLVSETHYYMSHSGYEPTRFLSEKAWKPIMFKHPFIMISTPGILTSLKQIGYQSFDGIINEDYDKISNDGDRMMAIIEETQRLCALTPEELTKFLNECREVCNFNYNVLLNKTKFQHRLNY